LKVDFGDFSSWEWTDSSYNDYSNSEFLKSRKVVGNLVYHWSSDVCLSAIHTNVVGSKFSMASGEYYSPTTLIFLTGPKSRKFSGQEFRNFKPFSSDSFTSELPDLAF